MAQPSTDSVLLALVLVVASVFVSACPSAGVNGVPPTPDAAADAGTSCKHLTTCDGTTVRACRDGRSAEVLEECGPDATCSLGRCASPGCAGAEANPASLLGCTFYTFDLDNVDADDLLPTSVLVTNPGQKIATVTLEQRMESVWTAVTTVEVAPMRSARLALADSHLEAGGRDEAGALRVTSNLPVSVAHVQSDDSGDHGSTSSGATLLLPAHVLGQRYRAVTYRQVATPRIGSVAGARGGAGQLIIVATADDTKVVIQAAAHASFGGASDVPTTGPGATFELVLDDGDLWQLYSENEGDDLTGTELKADKPIAVFSGNISTTYGFTATGVSSPDLAHEQLLPVRSWGTSFVAPYLSPQTAVCDSLFDVPGSSFWTFVADRDNTVVHISRPGPLGGPPLDVRLAAGESHQMQTDGNFLVTSNLPIQVMQGMDCEPTLASAIATNPLLTDLYFAVLPAFDTKIALVRRAGRPLFLDGARLDDTLFEPVGGGFDVGEVPIEPCPRAESVCTHHVEGLFGLTMRGMDVVASWALTAPTWIPSCDPDLPGCQ